MAHWNKAFWLLFIVMGALVVSGLIVRVLYLDIVLGIFVIAIGVLKLGEEMSSKEIVNRHGDINDNIRYLSHQMDAGNLFARRVKERHEHRFLKLDNRRTDIENIIDEKYDSVAKKVIQLENKLNDVTKALVMVSKRHDTHAKNTATEMKRFGRLKERTDRMSEKLRYIRAPKPAARAVAAKMKPKLAASAAKPKPRPKTLKTTKAKK
jgi:hypothetical protein